MYNNIITILSLQKNFGITGLYNGLLREPIRSESYLVDTFCGIGSIDIGEAHR